MALVQFSSLVDNIKGRIGASIFQKMGASYGIRSQVSRNFSVGNKAQGTKSNLSDLALAWNALSPDNKLLWISVASTYPAYNRYGIAFVMTGYQLFVQVNSMIGSAGGAYLAIPSVYALPIVDKMQAPLFVYSLSSFAFSWLASGNANLRYLFYLSKSYPSGSADKNPKTYFLGTDNANAGGNKEFFTALQTLDPWNFNANSSIYYEVWAIDIVTGSYGLCRQGWSQSF